MQDNPTPLSDHGVLEIAGPDALTFAQAQFMNDVATLADGEWQWNGWLNPKGRLIALFALLRRDAQTLWLLLPDYPPADLAQALGRYVFRSKVKLTPRSDLGVEGHWDATSARTSHEVSLPWPVGRRIDIHPTPPVGSASGDVESLARWKQADLRVGIPRLDATQSAQWTPQQLSLDRLHAYSVKKGCYPGQEIVARTHFLGQAKRGLRLLESAEDIAPGSEVSDGERAIGSVVSTAGAVAIAVLPTGAEPRSAGGLPVRAVDFAA